MPLQRHTDPRAFLAAAQPMLDRDAATAASFRSSMNALAEHPPGPGERLILAVHHGTATGALFVRGSGGAVIGESDPAAASAFAGMLAREWPALGSVVGAQTACEAFARTWTGLVGGTVSQRFRLRNHMLVEVSAVRDAPGRIRDAVPADRDWLVAAQRDFLVEARLPEGPVPTEVRVDRALALGAYRVWEDGDRVAYAAWAPADESSARIGPVHTLGEHRGRGYGTSLVASLSKWLLDGGRKRVFLVTDLANPVSNALYAKVGFVPTSAFVHLDLVPAGSA